MSILFQEAHWWGLVYYVRAITTTWQGSCGMSILFRTYKVTVRYKYMSALYYREIHLIRFISCYCTFIYNKCVNIFILHLLIITRLSLSRKFWINFSVIFCSTVFCCRKLHLRPPESFNHRQKSNIEIRGSIRGRMVVVRNIRTLIWIFWCQLFLGNILL